MPVIWSAVAVATPLWLLIATYAHIAHLDRSIPFAIVAIVLAAAFGYATEQLSKREPRPGQAIAAALFATGTLAALALGFTFALDKGWLTIALALMSLGTAWISLQRPVPFLRWLAAILAAIVVARIGYEPRIAGDDVGTMPIFNWLLYGYGIPALSFWAGSYYLRKRGDDAPLRMVEAAAILFTVLLAVHGDPPLRQWRRRLPRHAGLVEAALQVCTHAGAGDRPRTAARAHRQHRPQHRRARRHGDRGLLHRVRTVHVRNAAVLAGSMSAACCGIACCSATRCRRCCC